MIRLSYLKCHSGYSMMNGILTLKLSRSRKVSMDMVQGLLDSVVGQNGLSEVEVISFLL